MRRAVAIAVIALVALVLVPLVGGFMLPQAHVATRSAEFRVSPDSLWDIITGVLEYPAWRSGVTGVEVLAIRDGLPRWIERSSDGPVVYEAAEGQRGRRLVVRVESEGLPYDGEWTYEFTPAIDGGTTLAITERGEVFNPIFRFLSRFVLGHTTTIDRFLADLGRRLATPSSTRAP
jgi:hypothetical protein